MRFHGPWLEVCFDERCTSGRDSVQIRQLVNSLRSLQAKQKCEICLNHPEVSELGNNESQLSGIVKKFFEQELGLHFSQVGKVGEV